MEQRIKDIHKAVDIFAANNYTVEHGFNGNSTVIDPNIGSVTMGSFLLGSIMNVVIIDELEEELDKQYGDNDGYGEHVNYPSH